jgi:hypothetical protein
MADRDLRVSDFIRLYESLGCQAGINRNQFVIVSRTLRGTFMRFSQHAHKGLKDTFHRNVVRRSRRSLGFTSMPDGEFYRALD